MNNILYIDRSICEYVEFRCHDPFNMIILCYDKVMSAAFGMELSTSLDLGLIFL